MRYHYQVIKEYRRDIAQLTTGLTVLTECRLWCNCSSSSISHTERTTVQCKE